MTGKQRWDYGEWMLRAIANKQYKQRHPEPKPCYHDIHKVGITDDSKGDVQVYRRINGELLFEAESYDEARRVLEEEYGVGA